MIQSILEVQNAVVNQVQGLKLIVADMLEGQNNILQGQAEIQNQVQTATKWHATSSSPDPKQHATTTSSTLVT